LLSTSSDELALIDAANVETSPVLLPGGILRSITVVRVDGEGGFRAVLAVRLWIPRSRTFEK
jgi:hypothetical protein